MEVSYVVKPAKGTKKKCYDIIQEIAVAKDVVCQHPSCNRPADCGHHVFKRDRLTTAFLPEAVVGVCTQHHTGWAHNKPKDFKKFMIERLGEDRYYELRRLSYEHVEVMDYDEIYRGLVNTLRAYRRGA